MPGLLVMQHICESDARCGLMDDRRWREQHWREDRMVRLNSGQAKPTEKMQGTFCPAGVQGRLFVQKGRAGLRPTFLGGLPFWIHNNFRSTTTRADEKGCVGLSVNHGVYHRCVIVQTDSANNSNMQEHRNAHSIWPKLVLATCLSLASLPQAFSQVKVDAWNVHVYHVEVT